MTDLTQAQISELLKQQEAMFKKISFKSICLKHQQQYPSNVGCYYCNFSGALKGLGAEARYVMPQNRTSIAEEWQAAKEANR